MDNKIKLYDTDSVIVYADTGEPYETNEDITSHICGQSRVAEINNENGELGDWLPNTKWLPMTELSKEWQDKFIAELTEMAKL